MTRETKIFNFGRNVVFQPQVVVTPQSEEEVLQALRQHAGRRIRAIGRLHSWSEAPRSDDVMLDLRHLNGVQVEQRGDRVWATIGGGCQIKRVLAELERQAGVTLPSVGLITEQAIAGAISTGTHGSGKNSLSHYIDEVRIATYDSATNQPIIRTITSGPELRAARCSLGSMGVVLSVGLWTRPQYRVEEHFQQHTTLDSVIAAEQQTPLQQFYLIPWSWQFYGHHRRETDQPRSGLATLYRWYCWLTFDIGLHLMVLLLLRWIGSRGATKFFYRHLMPLTVVRNRRVVDRSYDMLTMQHDLFRHIEIEVFVKRSRLAEAIPFVIELLRYFDGDLEQVSEPTRERLRTAGLLDCLAPCAGVYSHHYPICVRRVLPDDTLISMASDDHEDCYAISIISFAKPDQRAGFFKFAEILARTTSTLFDARPHWGKYCPVDAATVQRLYPHLQEFRQVCTQYDPQGRFRNDWIDQVISPAKVDS